MQQQPRSCWVIRRRYVLTVLFLCIAICIAPIAIRETYLNYQVAMLIENITNPPHQNMHRSNQNLACEIVDAGGGSKLLNRFPHILDAPDRVAKTHVYEILLVVKLTNPAIRDTLLRIANDKSKDQSDRKDAIHALRFIDPVIDDFCNSVEELKSIK